MVVRGNGRVRESMTLRKANGMVTLVVRESGLAKEITTPLIVLLLVVREKVTGGSVGGENDPAGTEPPS
jgi:hypothetical protein